MNRRGGFAPIFILLIAGAILIAGGIWYWQAHQPSSLTTQTKSNMSEEVTSSTVDTSGWQLFTSQSGWSIEYPSSWPPNSCENCTNVRAPGIFVAFDPSNGEEGDVMVTPLVNQPATDTTQQWLQYLSHTQNLNNIVGENFITISGVPALEVTYSANPAGSGLDGQEVYIDDNSKSFDISFIILKSGVMSLKDSVNYPTYQAMVASFKVINENQEVATSSTAFPFNIISATDTSLATGTLSATGNYQIYANVDYGISFRYAVSSDTTPIGSPDKSPFGYAGFGTGNFLDYNGGFALAQYEVNGDLFAIIVDPNISSASSCYQWPGNAPGDSGITASSSQTIDGKVYSEIEGDNGTAGTIYYDYLRHTFQNGFCYELDLMIPWSDISDSADSTPIPSADQRESIDTNLIFKNLSFITPTLKNITKQDMTTPTLTSLTIASQTPDQIPNNAFSLFWTTQKADSVSLSTACAGSVLANPNTATASECDNLQSFGQGLTFQPASGSTTIDLYNLENSSSMSYIVTIEPFLHGIGYPAESKSITVVAPPEK